MHHPLRSRGSATSVPTRTASRLARFLLGQILGWPAAPRRRIRGGDSDFRWPFGLLGAWLALRRLSPRRRFTLRCRPARRLGPPFLPRPRARARGALGARGRRECLRRRHVGVRRVAFIPTHLHFARGMELCTRASPSWLSRSEACSSRCSPPGRAPHGRDRACGGRHAFPGRGVALVAWTPPSGWRPPGASPRDWVLHAAQHLQTNATQMAPQRRGAAWPSSLRCSSSGNRWAWPARARWRSAPAPPGAPRRRRARDSRGSHVRAVAHLPRPRRSALVPAAHLVVHRAALVVFGRLAGPPTLLRRNPMRRATRLLLATLAFAATGALAQSYPARPVKIIVPFAAGGPADVYARVLGREAAGVARASRSSSRTGPAPAPSSAPTPSPRARPTATRCS